MSHVTHPAEMIAANRGVRGRAGARREQYLAKNPNGCCGAGGAGVVFPIGDGVPA